jgi:hypothetical protein
MLSYSESKSGGSFPPSTIKGIGSSEKVPREPTSALKADFWRTSGSLTPKKGMEIGFSGRNIKLKFHDYGIFT